MQNLPALIRVCLLFHLPHHKIVMVTVLGFGDKVPVILCHRHRDMYMMAVATIISIQTNTNVANSDCSNTIAMCLPVFIGLSIN